MQSTYWVLGVLEVLGGREDVDKLLSLALKPVSGDTALGMGGEKSSQATLGGVNLRNLRE